MASIGPQLPPHLTKRKRTPDDEPSTDSPPSKLHASERELVNQDEVDLGSESENEDDYGPSAPISTSKPSIGPSLPPPPTAKPSIGPTLPPTNTDEIALDSDDDADDDTGPAPAPPPVTASEPKRIQGPAPPPAPLSERPSSPPNAPAGGDSDSDDSDDGYGPALPTSNSHLQRQAEAQKAAAYEAAHPSAPKRDDWMLAPPTAGLSRAPDPTKLKARKFNSGPRAAAAASSNGGAAGEISSIWTETPEQKRKRLENAVLGRDTGGNSNNRSAALSKSSGSADKAGDAGQQARIQNFTEATRGRSLYEEHQLQRQRDRENGGSSSSRGGRPFEEEDDPSKRAFDKEKDMKLGGHIGATQRRELLRKAADFGDRFAKGKYL
ncbi:hypothetical protein F4810DRAFT_711857 [Camillea tinctor]|nr:hypothetical protein F4810DRAFT_711857 [Camillea tinctor]